MSTDDAKSNVQQPCAACGHGLAVHMYCGECRIETLAGGPPCSCDVFLPRTIEDAKVAMMTILLMSRFGPLPATARQHERSDAPAATAEPPAPAGPPSEVPDTLREWFNDVADGRKKAGE